MLGEVGEGEGVAMGDMAEEEGMVLVLEVGGRVPAEEAASATIAVGWVIWPGIVIRVAAVTVLAPALVLLGDTEEVEVVDMAAEAAEDVIIVEKKGT